MEGWEKVTFGDLAVNLDSRRLPVKESDRRPGPYPYYGASGIVDHVSDFIFEGLHLLIAEDGENLRTRKLPVAFLADGRFWVNNHAHVMRGNARADTRFLSYAMQQADITGFLSGSTMPKLTQGNLLRVPVLAPPLPEQRAIAATLGALDDKIELNRRMCETLESMARALFRDWFVDFGPTRAKMAGTKPYLAADLWSLFPDRLDDDGKPERWGRRALLSQAELISGGTPKTDNPTFWNGDIPWASAKDVSQCKDCFLIETERSITNKGLEKSATKIIPPYSTVIVARGATTGRYCIFGASIAMNQTCYALASKFGVPFWLNLAFGSLVDEIIHTAHGSVFDTITTQTLLKVDLTVPGIELLRRFEGVVAPLFNKILSNQNESRTLAETRDLLLPRLMSGELRVAYLDAKETEPA